MLDRVLNIGCSFDWITPTMAFIQDFQNRPVSHFGVTANADLDRGDIRRLLQSKGVRVWGLMYNVADDLIMLSVQKSQAAWTYYIMMSEGVPVVYAPAEVTGGVKKRSIVCFLLGW